VYQAPCQKCKAAQHGLQPTRLSRLEFDTGFAIVGGSGPNGTLQTRLAAEPHRSAASLSLEKHEGGFPAEQPASNDCPSASLGDAVNKSVTRKPETSVQNRGRETHEAAELLIGADFAGPIDKHRGSASKV
jgi:hypothetical protein